MQYPDTSTAAIAQRYRTFARTQARGISARYDALAQGTASSTRLLAFLAALPPDRQQPNLFFAAVRHVCGVPSDIAELEALVAENEAPIRATMLSRTTQTNEPARCAVLLPALSTVAQPLALIEVGASAGLCLLLDSYAYDYGDRKVAAAQISAAVPPEFPCAANPETPIPEQSPSIVWRAGLDLNPLDVGCHEEMDWLQTLVWPEQSDRSHRLQSAINIARKSPPNSIAAI